MTALMLYVVAFSFAIINGSNTGGTMLSLSLTIRSLRPSVGVIIMTLGVITAPLLFGTAVASTVANDLIVWEGPDREFGMMLAVIASIVVVWVLSWLGTPTGLTLALIGAIAGVGMAAGQPVGWSAVGTVLVMMALAPLLGGIIAAILVRLVAPWLRLANAGRALRVTHIATFAFMSLAYGTNDAQKMLAVLAIAAGTASPTVPIIWWHLLVIGVFFSIGTALGLGRMASTIGSGVLPVRTLDAVSAEVATATALLVTSIAGAPVGLAQTISGALIGSGAARGVGRVRWRKAGMLVVAWVTTLPAAYLLGAVVGALAFRV